MNYLRDDDFLKALGKHVRILRKSKNLTQEKLAFEIGVEISQISRLERGLLNTSVSIVNEIARALDLPIKDLFDFNT